MAAVLLTKGARMFTVFTMSDNQRERILACACELYLDGGIEGFSMRKLARTLGVTAPALYRYFDNKDAVLVDVVREAYQRLSQHLYEALKGRCPAERFRLAGEGYLDFALANPRLYDIVFAAPDHMGWQCPPPEVEAQAGAIGQFWNDRVRECMDAGILRRGDPHDISVTLWAHAHGLLTLYLRGSLHATEEEVRSLFRVSTRRVLVGLATEEYAASLLASHGPECGDEIVVPPTPMRPQGSSKPHDRMKT